MSAAAISQHVFGLETHFGRPLFERTANRIRLTAESGDFLPAVQVSLGAIESEAASLFARQRVEKVSLFASQLMAMSWLPRALKLSWTVIERRAVALRHGGWARNWSCEYLVLCYNLSGYLLRWWTTCGESGSSIISSLG